MRSFYEFWCESTRRNILKGIGGTIAAAVTSPLQSSVKIPVVKLSRLLNKKALSTLEYYFFDSVYEPMLAQLEVTIKRNPGEQKKDFDARMNKVVGDMIDTKVQPLVSKMVNDFVKDLRVGKISDEEAFNRMYNSTEATKTLYKLIEGRVKSWFHAVDKPKEIAYKIDYLYNQLIHKPSYISHMAEYWYKTKLIPASDIKDDKGSVILSADTLVKLKVAAPIEIITRYIDKAIQRIVHEHLYGPYKRNPYADYVEYSSADYLGGAPPEGSDDHGYKLALDSIQMN